MTCNALIQTYIVNASSFGERAACPAVLEHCADIGVAGNTGLVQTETYPQAALF